MDLKVVEKIDEGTKSLMGFAMRSKNLLCGYNSVMVSKERNVGIIFISTSLQESSLKKIKKKFTNSDSVLYLYEGYPGELINRPDIKVLGVKKSDFISGIMKNINRMEKST